jgi:hypothetical protein
MDARETGRSIEDVFGPWRLRRKDIRGRYENGV